MAWSSLPELLEMGGFGLYVWGAYVMVAAAAVWEAATLTQRRRRVLEELRGGTLEDHDAA
jgi:heme exporter protein D